MISPKALFAVTAFGSALAVLQPLSADSRHPVAGGQSAGQARSAFPHSVPSCPAWRSSGTAGGATHTPVQPDYPPPPGFWPPPGSTPAGAGKLQGMKSAEAAATYREAGESAAVRAPQHDGKQQRGKRSQGFVSPAQQHPPIEAPGMLLIPHLSGVQTGVRIRM
jgi:hypothetical protein